MLRQRLSTAIPLVVALACASAGCGGAKPRRHSREPREIDDGWAANKVYRLSSDEVSALIKSARKAQPIPVELVVGRRRSTPGGTWKKSTRDPGKVVAAFPTLHLRDRYVMRAYEHWQGLNASGRVFAIAEGSPFPTHPPRSEKILGAPRIARPAGFAPSRAEAEG